LLKFSFNQSTFLVIGKNLFNDMKVANFNQSIVSIKIKNSLTHITNMHAD